MKLRKSLFASLAIGSIVLIACGDLDPADAPIQVAMAPTSTQDSGAPPATNTPAVEPIIPPPLPHFAVVKLELHEIEGNLELAKLTAVLGNGACPLRSGRS